MRIRMLLSVTVAPSLGAVSRHGAEFAVEDIGPVHGRQVDLDDPVDTSCSPEGGREGTLGIIGDPQVAGVIGTNCLAAAVAASPVISAAGLVMISPSNTSPRLTSDLAGNANPDYHAGYFRVSSNDLHQARALSDFVYHQLELRSVAWPSCRSGSPALPDAADSSTGISRRSRSAWRRQQATPYLLWRRRSRGPASGYASFAGLGPHRIARIACQRRKQVESARLLLFPKGSGGRRVYGESGPAPPLPSSGSGSVRDSGVVPQ